MTISAQTAQVGAAARDEHDYQPRNSYRLRGPCHTGFCLAAVAHRPHRDACRKYDDEPAARGAADPLLARRSALCWPYSLERGSGARNLRELKTLDPSMPRRGHSRPRRATSANAQLRTLRQLRIIHSGAATGAPRGPAHDNRKPCGDTQEAIALCRATSKLPRKLAMELVAGGHSDHSCAAYFVNLTACIPVRVATIK